MSIWNKIVNLFVEEEEEVIEDAKVESVIDTQKPQIKLQSTPVEKPAVKEAVKEEKEVREVKKEEKKSIFINEKRPASSQSTSSQPQSSKPASSSASSSVPGVKTYEGTDYEFRPVISPMFGVNEAEVVTRPVMTTTTSPVHNSSVLGTIVSPIYGLSPKEEQTPVIVADNAVEEDIENFSLEDLLYDDSVKAEETEEEMKFDIPFVEKNIVDQDAAGMIMQNARLTDSFVSLEKEKEMEEKKEELKEALTFDTDEPTVENIVFGTQRVQKAAAVEEEKAVTKDVEEEKGANADEIRRAFVEFSEEDLFEKEKQPTLFDL